VKLEVDVNPQSFFLTDVTAASDRNSRTTSCHSWFPWPRRFGFRPAWPRAVGHRARKRFLLVSSAHRLVSCRNLFDIGLGGRLNHISPHEVTTKSQRRLPIVGTFGSVGQRCDEVTASARIAGFDLRDVGRRLSTAKVTSPESIAGSLRGAAERHVHALTTGAAANSTPDRCGVVPGPGADGNSFGRDWRKR